jgi:hypothetical protein
MKDLIVDPAKETVACPATPKRPFSALQHFNKGS